MAEGDDIISMNEQVPGIFATRFLRWPAYCIGIALIVIIGYSGYLLSRRADTTEISTFTTTYYMAGTPIRFIVQVRDALKNTVQPGRRVKVKYGLNCTPT